MADTPAAPPSLSRLAIDRSAAVVRRRRPLWKRWWAWLLLHIYKLIGFRNRLTVMTQWAFSYFTYQRSVRLILGKR